MVTGQRSWARDVQGMFRSHGLELGASERCQAQVSALQLPGASRAAVTSHLLGSPSLSRKSGGIFKVGKGFCVFYVPVREGVVRARPPGTGAGVGELKCKK